MFPSFADFRAQTHPFGTPGQVDPSDEDDPVGILELANCACSSTIALRWEGAPRTAARAELREAVREMARTSGHDERAVMVELRRMVHARLLRDTP